MSLDNRPNLARQCNHSDLSSGHVLLVREGLVSGDENVEAGIFRRLHQFSVLQAVESREGYGHNIMLR